MLRHASPSGLRRDDADVVHAECLPPGRPPTPTETEIARLIEAPPVYYAGTKTLNALLTPIWNVRVWTL